MDNLETLPTSFPTQANATQAMAAASEVIELSDSQGEADAVTAGIAAAALQCEDDGKDLARQADAELGEEQGKAFEVYGDKGLAKACVDTRLTDGALEHNATTTATRNDDENVDLDKGDGQKPSGYLQDLAGSEGNFDAATEKPLLARGRDSDVASLMQLEAGSCMFSL